MGDGTENTREHQPKLAALLAWEAGLLSAQGARRLSSHLETCPVCQQTLSAVRSYSALRQDIVALEPAIDWSRVEMPSGAPEVERDSVPERAALRARLSRRRLGWIAGGAGAVAAAAAAVGLGLFGWQGAEPAQDPAPTARVAPETKAPAGSPLRGWATAFSEGAEIERQRGQGFRPVSPASTVAVGSTLRLADGAVLDLALDSGATLRLRSAEVHFARLDSRVVRLELRRGEVAQRVPPLLEGAIYAVAAGEHEVRVHGTHFVVRRGEAGAAVELFEGEVVVHDGDGRAVATLESRGQWRAPTDPAPADPAPTDDDRPLVERVAGASPMAFVSREGGAIVGLPMSERVVAWKRNDSLVPADLALRMLLPLGEQTLIAVLPSGQEVPLNLDIGPKGLVLTPARLSRLLPPTAPRTGSLAPERLRAVLKAGQPRLQQCYERALRRFPALQPALSLRIDLRTSGSVRGVRIVQGEAPEQFERCIERVASGFRFPAPGGPMTFDAPLRFRRKL